MITLISDLNSKSDSWWEDHISEAKLIPITPLQTADNGDYLIEDITGEKRIQLTFDRQYTPTDQTVTIPNVDIKLTPGDYAIYTGGILILGEDCKFPATLTFSDNLGLTAKLTFTTKLAEKQEENDTPNLEVATNPALFTNSNYPNGIDTYNIPSQPNVAYLSQNNNYPGGHAVTHQALNDSIYSIESNAFVDNSATSHDHSDPYDVDYSQSRYMSDPQSKHGRQLRIQNTHVTSDTNTTPNSEESQSADSLANTWHHTVVDPTSTNTPTQWQAVSWALWQWLGLNTLPQGYFSDQFPNMVNGLKQEMQTTAGASNTVQNSFLQLIDKLNGALQAFNTYYDNRCNHFIGEYPAEAIEFTPTSNINQVQSGGVTTNYAQVDVFSRWAVLHLHPFFSAHTGISSQVMIYQQTPQSDGSIWRPNYEIFFPMAVEEQDVNNPNQNWSRDISWKPDGNIYISSLGNPGEYDRVVNTIAKMPYNIQMQKVDGNGNIVQSTNQPPFPSLS